MRSPINYSGVNDHTVHMQPDQLYPGGGIQQLLGGLLNRGGGTVNAGGRGGDMRSLIESVQRNIDSANAANESRYGQELGLWDQGKGDMMGAIQQIMGQILGAGTNPAPALAREQKRSADVTGRLQGDLAARGLGNTNLQGDIARGVADDSAIRTEEIYNNTNNQQNAARSQMLNMILSTIGQYTAGKTGAIERRTDQGPDLDAISRILMQPGANGQGFSAAAGLLPLYGRTSQPQPQIGGTLTGVPGNGASASLGVMPSTTTRTLPVRKPRPVMPQFTYAA